MSTRVQPLAVQAEETRSSGACAVVPPQVRVVSRWTDYISLLRPGYWIKNVFVAPGILLAFYFQPDCHVDRHGLAILIALISTCLVASSNYVINEILDAAGDAHHPDKCARAIPSGRVRVSTAYILWALLALVGLALAYQVNLGCLLACASLWVMGLAYNVPPVRLKDIPYGDVLSESVNNPIRMAIGWYAVGMDVPPTLSVLLAYWMFGAFLMGLKRFAEYRHIGQATRAGTYRKSFKWYNEERLLVSILFYAALFGMFSGVFICRYRLELVLATPIVALAMASYFRMGFKSNSPVMNPEELWRSPTIMVPAVLAFAACSALLFIEGGDFTQLFAPTMVPRDQP